MSLRLGVDVGGTFTDVLLVSEESGDLTIAKVLSTPEDQSVGRDGRGASRRARRTAWGSDALSLILHGSTVVTNMILEEKGAVGGLLTTRGPRADPPPRACVDPRSALRVDGDDQARSARAAAGSRAACRSG